jgi:aspartate/methionine/tyrosine aminotransferase
MIKRTKRMQPIVGFGIDPALRPSPRKLGTPRRAKAISDFTAERSGPRYDPEREIVITAGGMEALVNFLLCEHAGTWDLPIHAVKYSLYREAMTFSNTYI